MGNWKPLVSVIVPTHNRQLFLRQAVSGIMYQGFSDFELIVVADGHQEDVASYLKSVDDRRIKYISADFTGRPAAVRNIGIRQSCGEVLAFCDDDDIWYPQKLESQLRTMQALDAGFTFTAAVPIDAGGRVMNG